MVSSRALLYSPRCRDNLLFPIYCPGTAFCSGVPGATESLWFSSVCQRDSMITCVWWTLRRARLPAPGASSRVAAIGPAPAVKCDYYPYFFGLVLVTVRRPSWQKKDNCRIACVISAVYRSGTCQKDNETGYYWFAPVAQGRGRPPKRASVSVRTRSGAPTLSSLFRPNDLCICICI
jgi:hypothetical protein